MGIAAKLAHWVCGDYSLYFIYRWQSSAMDEQQPVQIMVRPSADDLLSSQRAAIAEQQWYLGSGCEPFAISDDSGPAAVCFYWHGERYRQRNFWPLQEDEAKLVQIVVDPSARGRGLASGLIAASAAEMAKQGWRTLYARIWHSNQPSLRAFERAGWRRIAFVAELFPFGTRLKLRIRLPMGPRTVR